MDLRRCAHVLKIVISEMWMSLKKGGENVSASREFHDDQHMIEVQQS